MLSGLPTVGQTAVWAGFQFVKKTFQTVTGEELNSGRVVSAAKKDGASAIVDWLEACAEAELALMPMLSRASAMYVALKDKCASRKRRFSVCIEDGSAPALVIDGVGSPPHDAARFAAAAVLYSWLPEEISKAISPPHSVKNAEEYYQFLHIQWEKLCKPLTYTLVEALQNYGGVDVSHDSVTMPLAPYQALFDALFFSHKAPVILSSSVTRPEAIEVSMARASIPQSISDALKQFSATNASVLPATTVERDAFYRVRSTIVEKAWEATFEAGVLKAPEEAFACVPVSTVTHENEQLKFNRTGIPLCCNGAGCVAKSYPQLCSPLNKYLYPQQQEFFNSHGHLPDEMAMPGECLLCIRDAIHIVVRVASASVMNPRQLVGRRTVIAPPFQNIVGPGGYRPECCLQGPPEILPNAVVGSHLMPLRMTYSATDSQWFLDQRDLIWNPSSN